MTRFRPFRVIALALSLALVAAACGDDDDTAASDDTAVEDTATEDMASDDTMAEDDAAPASSAEACDADAIVAAVQGGADEGTLEGITDDPVGTAASNNPVLTTLVTAVGEAGLVDTLTSAEVVVSTLRTPGGMPASFARSLT